MKAALPTLALLILLTGCGATAPENQPKTPTPAAASETTDPLYEEAVAVAKAIDEIDQRYYYQNKYDPFPEEEYSKYAAGSFVEASKELYKRAAENKIENIGMENASIRYRPLVGVTLENSEIAIQQCSDGSDTKHIRDGEESFGIKNQSNYFFKHIDGELKVFNVSLSKEGRCDW